MGRRGLTGKARPHRKGEACVRTCRRGGSEAWRCLKGRPSKQRDSQNTGQQEVPRRPEASQGGCEGEAERASKRRAVREAAKVEQSERVESSEG